MSNAKKLDELIGRHKKSGSSEFRGEQPKLLPQVFFNRIECLRIADVASATGLCTKTIERLVKKGDLPAKKIGRSWIIPRSSFESWLHDKGN